MINFSDKINDGIDYKEWAEQHKDELLRSAVAAIDPDKMGMTRDNALTLAGAMKNCGFSREEFAEVMARSSADKGTFAAQWDNFRGEGKHGPAGEGTIYQYAQRSGWKWPKPDTNTGNGKKSGKKKKLAQKNDTFYNEVTADYKIQCLIDSEHYTSKPTAPWMIRSREQSPTPDPAPITMADFAQAVTAGQTFSPTVYNKTDTGNKNSKGKTIYEYIPQYQQVFVVDIDNEEIALDEDRKPIVENGKQKKKRIDNPMTIEKALEICQNNDIAPFLIYETFSSKAHRDDPTEPYIKFRICFALDAPLYVQDVGTRGINAVIEYFIGLFGGSADTATTDPARLIYGTDEKDRATLYPYVIKKSKIFELIKRPVIREDDLAAADDPAATLPEWIFTAPSRTGDVKKINEPKFCDIFKAEHHVVRVNGQFYFEGQPVTDDFILNEIQKLIQVYFIERVGILTGNICKTLSNSCYATQPEPDERKVYCAGEVTLTISDSGEISQQQEDVFTLTRLPVSYDPEASCPTFEKYLQDVFFEEDIPAIQEYVGYCLIPSTRAQAGLFVHGKGGEGKSVFRDVLMRLFGHTAKQESICNLEKQFVLANMENMLVCIDDDMEISLMGDTSMLKKIITMKGLQQVEKKHVQKQDALIFVRIIGIGNSFIGSKFDQSDGFYRRQLLIDCKPKTREKDDRFMSDRCTAEIQGILNWALVGLCRLINNGFNFTISQRMQETLNSIRRENDNVLTFIENNIEESDRPDAFISSAELFDAYALECKDNGDTPVKKKTFQTRIAEKYRNRKDRRYAIVPVKGKMNPEKKKVNGYKGIKFVSPEDGIDWGVRLFNTSYSEDLYLERTQ